MIIDRSTLPAKRDCDLTVVVACVEAARSIEQCLEALDSACTGIDTQVLVVNASRDKTAAIVRKRWPSLEILEQAPGTLVPRLWAAGLRAARGRTVAFTIGQVAVSPKWARALLKGIEAAGGVGGPMLLAAGAGPVEWGLFYLRYSAFLPLHLPDGPALGEIAGDNAAYARSVLIKHVDALADGFWEVEFHRRMRADGEQLRVSSDATAALLRSSPLACLVRHRYKHGCHFGVSRVLNGASVPRIVAASPIVPMVLATRSARRVFALSEHRWRFVAALPVFLVLAIAWAAGEAQGALRAGRR